MGVASLWLCESVLTPNSGHTVYVEYNSFSSSIVPSAVLSAPLSDKTAGVEASPSHGNNAVTQFV